MARAILLGMDTPQSWKRQMVLFLTSQTLSLLVTGGLMAGSAVALLFHKRLLKAGNPVVDEL
jgi:hypothetical protein